MASCMKYWYKVGLPPYAALILTLVVSFHQSLAEWSLAAVLPWGLLAWVAIVAGEHRHERTRWMTLPELLAERRRLALSYVVGAAGLISLLGLLDIVSPGMYLLAPVQGLLARQIHERTDFELARLRALSQPTVYEYA